MATPADRSHVTPGERDGPGEPRRERAEEVDEARARAGGHLRVRQQVVGARQEQGEERAEPDHDEPAEHDELHAARALALHEGEGGAHDRRRQRRDDHGADDGRGGVGDEPGARDARGEHEHGPEGRSLRERVALVEVEVGVSSSKVRRCRSGSTRARMAVSMAPVCWRTTARVGVSRPSGPVAKAPSIGAMPDRPVLPDLPARPRCPCRPAGSCVTPRPTTRPRARPSTRPTSPHDGHLRDGAAGRHRGGPAHRRGAGTARLPRARGGRRGRRLRVCRPVQGARGLPVVVRGVGLPGRAPSRARGGRRLYERCSSGWPPGATARPRPG